jgi:hypothetical protein
MAGSKRSTFVLAALLLFGSVITCVLWVFDAEVMVRDDGSPDQDAAQAQSQSEQRRKMTGWSKDRRSISGRGGQNLGEKVDRDQLRAEAQRTAGLILDGSSILEHLPDYTGLTTMIFLEELQKALRVDLSSSGDFGKIEKIFSDLDGAGDKFGGVKIRLLRFATTLNSGSDPSSDITAKVSLFETLNRSGRVMQFSNYLAEVGAKKVLGPIDGDVISAIPIADRRSLLWGMARSGDLDAITTVLGVREEAERGALLKYTVKELMESQPGKTISYIDEMQDPVQREFCLTFAVESLRMAGATVDAEEWAKQLQSASHKN